MKALLLYNNLNYKVDEMTELKLKDKRTKVSKNDKRIKVQLKKYICDLEKQKNELENKLVQQTENGDYNIIDVSIYVDLRVRHKQVKKLLKKF